MAVSPGFLRSRNYVYESGKFDPEVYIRGPTKAIPTQDVRADAVGHWPQIDSVRQRCKFPKCTGHTSFKYLVDNVVSQCCADLICQIRSSLSTFLSSSSSSSSSTSSMASISSSFSVYSSSSSSSSYSFSDSFYCA
ncbi:hypothetical protein QQF64_034136 [Cirrhinus molitorella]|uniref:Uncharacterized protein n=1 Tax=Cirrhinus molitorella TaxID=172907 RepID=A0ABR3MVV5_9TELE